MLVTQQKLAATSYSCVCVYTFPQKLDWDYVKHFILWFYNYTICRYYKLCVFFKFVTYLAPPLTFEGLRTRGKMENHVSYA